MSAPSRALIAAIVLALVATACSPTTAIEATTTTPSIAPTTTRVSTTTTVAITTTTRPLETVRVIGDMPPEIAAATGAFLSTVHDPRNDTAAIEPELIAHHAALSGSLDEVYSGTATTKELETGGAVAVVTLEGEELIILADEGAGWHVVGSDLALGAGPWFGESPRRVLVLGSDARPGGAPAVHRMDSIHVLTAVPQEGAGTILGWPRDTWIESPYGDMRVNALTTSGRGADAIFSHFTDTWDIPLDGYILTAFSGFEKLIAASVGRLIINLPISIPAQEWWPGFRSGEQTLNPTRTLDYARTRKQVPGGDFARSKHQGVIMLAVLTMLQQGSVEDVPSLLGELVKYTETNLSPSDLIQLGVAAFYMDVGDVTNTVLPGQLGRATGGKSVVFLDPEADGIITDVIADGLLGR